MTTIPRPTPTGYEYDGQTYPTLHEAIRAMHAARQAEAVTVVVKAETDKQRQRRQRREATGR